MSYFSNTEDQSLGSSFGCGSECNCGPCKSGMSGLDEWYEKEEADEPAEVTPPSVPSPSQPPCWSESASRVSTTPESARDRFGLLRDAEINCSSAWLWRSLGVQCRNLYSPELPLGQMPTNPVVPKPWCSELAKIQSNTCFPYAPQEIAISKTEAGHLSTRCRFDYSQVWYRKTIFSPANT